MTRPLDLHPVSRGLAVWGGRAWMTGSKAVRACRVDPQAVVSDVWESLSLQPLPAGRGKVRHRADLAVACLLADGFPPGWRWTAAAPAAWEKDALQVFLGVARECKIDIRWLVPRAAALAASLNPDTDRVFVLEWSWNTMHNVEVLREGEGWRRGSVQILPEGGVFNFFRREARLVQETALNRLRWDPLYSGQSEQAVFDAWWASISGDAPLTLSAPGGASLDFSGEASRIRAAHLPWVEANGLSDSPDMILPPALRAVLGWSSCLTESVPFSFALADHGQESAKWRDAVSLGDPSQDLDGGPRVTHLVVNGIAEPWSGNAVPGQSLTLPDGREGLAIHVPEPHAAP